MAYQRDPRGPLERLYGFEKIQAARQEMQKQQAMQQQREQILRESYQPGEEARTEYAFEQAPQQGGMSNIMGALGIADAPQMQAKQIEGRPASLDAQSAIARLYGGNDLEGASALINDQYKGSMASRADGGGANAAYGSEYVPSDKEGFMHPAQYMRGGGLTIDRSVYIPEKLTYRDLGGADAAIGADGQVRQMRAKTANPFQQFQMDPEAQGAIAEAKAAGAERGDISAKADIGAEKGIPVVDKTLGIVDELRSHPGREWATGGSSWTSAIPGTPAYDFGVKLEQLTGQTFLNEVEKMRGLGTLTETEGRKLSVAAAALNAAQSEPEFLRQLEIFRGELESARGRYQQRLDGGRAPAASRPSPSRAPVAQSKAMPSLPNPAQHKGRTVRDTKSGIRYQSNGSQWMRVK